MYNNQYMQPQFGRYMPEPQYQQPNLQYQAPIQQPIAKPLSPVGLQGKMVDNIEVVKSTDIPLDGSLSVFPLTDGSAIVTKQLQNDGTSKIVVYKPVTEKEKEIKYLTRNDLDAVLSEFTIEDIEDIKEELKELKKEIKGIKKEK